MSRALLRPVLRAEFTLESGDVLVREWRIREAIPGWTERPPEWLDDPRRTWPRPQDPITLTGRVQPGREGDARRAMGLGPA